MDGGDDDVVGMTQQMTQEVQTQVNMGTCQETAFQVEPWFFLVILRYVCCLVNGCGKFSNLN